VTRYIGNAPAAAVITSDQLSDAVVTTAKLDDEAVTEAKIEASVLTQSRPQLGTVKSVSSTVVDFTGIPSWVKKITVTLVAVSTNGTSRFIVQIGDSGGVASSGYAASRVNLTNAGAVSIGGDSTGFHVMNAAAAADAYRGVVVLTLHDPATNTWVSQSTIRSDTGTTIFLGVGSKALAAALDRVRLTTDNGTDAFDAGSVNILYE
jgi:hypothetical protein